jgi:hypothetical protein
MTTTETIDHEAAHDLLVRTAANNGVDTGIGTPTNQTRNYSLAEAMACAATCDEFTLATTNGFMILTGHNRTVGDYVWYIVPDARRADPWA